MEMVLIFTFCLILAGTDAVTTVTGYRGRSVQIKCPYTSGYEEYNKYLCRGECSSWKHKDVPVYSGSPNKDSRFSLYDNKTAKVFTITITDLRPEDEGTYWCGIDRLLYDIYTEVKLLVKMDDPSISTVSHYTHSALNNDMNISVHAESKHSTTEFSTFTVIIGVSLGLALLLVTLLFVVTLMRKTRTRASQSPTQPPESSTNHHVVRNPDYVYEEIKDSKNISNTLYFTVLPPSIPTKIYSNTGLPTVPFDHVDSLYSTVDHPSDSPDQDIYSTAQ